MTRIILALVTLLNASTLADAAVLCVSKKGAVFLRDACRKKERAIDPVALGLKGPKGDKGDPGEPGPAGTPDSPDAVRAKFFAGTACPGNDSTDVMVRVGDLCVDVYEASVWSAPAGGTRYGVVSADYPCAADGSDCTAIYARSVAGVLPSRYVTWFQAQQACRNAGKRLLSNAEWQAAAAGTPDPGNAGDGVTTCNTNTSGLKETGAGTGCVSVAGVRDMVGNLWEWVAEWAEPGVTCTGWDALNDDAMCLAVFQYGSAATPPGPPGTPGRGGNWDYSLEAGPFAVDASVHPTSSYDHYGFRCAR